MTTSAARPWREKPSDGLGQGLLVPSAAVVGLPPIVETLLGKTRGLFLVTGPTGSGKTTTLATLVDYINDHFDKLLARHNPEYTPAEAAASMTAEGNAILSRNRLVRESTGFGRAALFLALVPILILVWRLFTRSRRKLSPLKSSSLLL